MSVDIRLLNNFINLLLKNQNHLAPIETQNLLTFKDYYSILEPVAKMKIGEKSIEKIVDDLIEHSEIIKTTKDFVYNEGIIPGVSMAFGTKNIIIKILCGKKSDCGSGNECGSDLDIYSIFDLASVTKLFVSALALRLVEEKKLDLEKNITFYEPRFTSLENIMVDDLLCFRKSLKTAERLTTLLDKHELEDIIYKTYNEDSLFDPRPYSDIPYIVLKYVIENILGTDIFTGIAERILEPLRMNGTFLNVPHDLRGNIVSCDNEYMIKDETYLSHITPLGSVNDDKARIINRFHGMSGHAGLFSTVDDMIKFSLSFFNNDILLPSSIEEIGRNRTGRIFNGIYSQYLGYGCYSKHPYPNDSEVYHALSGNAISISGFTGTHITIDPGNKVFLFIASNRCNNRVSKIVNSPDAEKNIKSNGIKREIVWLDGSIKKMSDKYAYLKDAYLRDPALDLSLRFRFLEYCLIKNGKTIKPFTTMVSC